MARIRKSFSVSLLPEMADELAQVRSLEHKTRSELVREALRRYFRDRLWMMHTDTK
jgi:metal-responsive CopG/Arc/MetJ family transcriptional regulator